MLHKVMSTATAVALLGLAACADYGFPTTAEALCGAFTYDCHPECHATPMPALGADPRAVSYHIGPASCPARYVGDARRLADQACDARGMTLASTEPQLAQQPPAGPLPAPQVATFRCQQ